MDDKELQIYQLLYQAYADEIKNLWQRSIFLASFMVLVWTGYGALQLKALDKDFSVSAGYCLVSFGLCGAIIILSLLWIAMAKGSKFVQEAHEEHITSFEFNNAKIKQLFCDLNIYEPKLKYKKKLSARSPLKAYPYSPSKINIALGWVSLLVGFILLNIHTLRFCGVKLKDIKECFLQIMQECFLLITQLVKCLQSLPSVLCVFIFTLLILFILYLFLHCVLKSKETK